MMIIIHRHAMSISHFAFRIFSIIFFRLRRRTVRLCNNIQNGVDMCGSHQLQIQIEDKKLVADRCVIVYCEALFSNFALKIEQMKWKSLSNSMALQNYMYMHRLNNGKWERVGPNDEQTRSKSFESQNRIQIWMTLSCIFHAYNMCVSEIENVSDSMAVMRTFRTKFLWRIEATRRRTSNARKMLKFWCVRIHCADIFFVLLIWPNYRDEKTLYPWHCSTHFFSLCSSLLLLLL